jgi:hypothetical protein
MLVALLGSTAMAVPVDLNDPTPRTVRVEIDQDETDFAAIGAAYGLPLPATFTSNGVVATISVDGSAMGAFMNQYFEGFLSAVPGTISEYVITIDVVSGQVLSADLSGTLSTFVGNVPFTQTASSTTIAGFVPISLGYVLPQFCTPLDAGCTIVPGAPYDPLTGGAVAVGVVSTIVNVFAAFGDIRLSENPLLSCDTAVDQKNYILYEGVDVGLALHSSEATDRAIELKVWIERADGLRVSAVNVGAEGTHVLLAGQDLTFGSIPLFLVEGEIPFGQWTIGCRILDPITGETLAQDGDSFPVQASR